MARRRFNGLVTVLDGGITNSATSASFTAALTYGGGTAVPTIASPDYVPLTILDINGEVSEIVHLTAYTSGATSGTIVRGREGTTGVSHDDGDKVVHAPTRHDHQPYPNPRSHGALDDEFDGLSAASWTSGPTAPTTWDIDTTAPDRAYMRSNGNSSAFVAKHQPIPGAYPFTVITRVNSNRRGSTTLGLGLILSVASPGSGDKILWYGPTYNSGFRGQRLAYNTFSTASFSSAVDMGAGVIGWAGEMWLRMIVNSATSIDFAASLDGDTWHTSETGFNPGFTPGVIGLGMSENGTADLSGVADFFRVT